jgi:hypothetical protein|tara:strand:- start:1015 stop:2502 length:1488 start_codon:yes stop_codon:yes gene_type:complete
MAHYLEIHDVSFADDCKIYVRADVEKKVFYCRIQTTVGHRKYLIRSLKTTDIVVAEARAKEIYMQLRISEKRGLPLSAPLFKDVIKPFVDDMSCGADRKRTVSAFLRKMADAVGSIKCEDINEQLFYEFMKGYAAERGGLAKNTLTMYRGGLVQLLKYAKRENYIAEVPDISFKWAKYGVHCTGDRVYAKGLSKAWHGRWNALFATHWVNAKYRSTAHRYAVLRLNAMFRFCYHTYVRPTTEATGIKFKDVVKKEDREGFKYYFITVRDAKTSRTGVKKPRRTVFPVEFVHHFDKWVEVAKEYGFYDPDNYVFPDYLTQRQKDNGERPRRMKMQALDRLFAKILIDLSPRKSKRYPNGYDMTQENGLRVSFMSATRHSALTRALIDQKVPAAVLARHAGTSLQMLDRFYLAELDEASSIEHASAYKHVPKSKRLTNTKVRFTEETEDKNKEEKPANGNVEEKIFDDDQNKPLTPAVAQTTLDTTNDINDPWFGYY